MIAENMDSNLRKMTSSLVTKIPRTLALFPGN